MELTLLLSLSALVFLGHLAVRLRAGRLRATVTSGPAPDGAVGAGAQEIVCTRRLLAGTMSRTEHAAEMARIAAASSSAEFDVATMVWCAGRKPADDEDLRRLLRRVAVALPELPVGTVRSALALARAGAEVDELIRMLRLTRLQARTIRTVVQA